MQLKIALITLMMIVVFPQAAWAYVGPGAGIGAIAAFIGVVLCLLLAVFGFLWYPIKRFRQKRKDTRVKSKAD